MRKRSTRTSPFGSPGRIAHDSSAFYASRLYEGSRRSKTEVAADVPASVSASRPVPVDRLFCESSEHMDDVPDSSVHLMVTSPPYNVTKEYDEDLTLDEYRGLLKRVFAEVYKKLASGGRACVNVANLGRKPYIALHSYVIEDMLEIGYLMRGEIIWNKGASASPSTAWGTWRSAANPVLRDVHEYVLVFSKGSFNRKPTAVAPPGEISAGTNTITRDEFLEYTKSVWTFPAEPARKIGHPAPFPVELPYRLIQLYTFKDDVVLDPFCGSGSTCLAAIKAGRHYVGYDNKEEYVKLAEKRIRQYGRQLSAVSLQLFEEPSSARLQGTK
jgi:site-specific DNA-methyltransferase (adenine-specific)